MIVFDLRCAQGHVFEAWFGSGADYDDQQGRGLLSCPICGQASVEKAVMAPAVSAKGNRCDPVQAKAAMRELAKQQARMLENSQWVGTDFADRARSMHEGEEPHSTIHGQASVTQVRALVEEGVPLTPLPFPVVDPGTRN